MCIYFNVATANVYCDSHVPDALCSILNILTHLSLQQHHKLGAMIIFNLPTRKLRHRTVKQLGWGCCWQEEGWDLEPGIVTVPTRSTVCDNAYLDSRSLGDKTELGCLEWWPQPGNASPLKAPRGTE